MLDLLTRAIFLPAVIIYILRFIPEVMKDLKEYRVILFGVPAKSRKRKKAATVHTAATVSYRNSLPQSNFQDTIILPQQ